VLGAGLIVGTFVFLFGGLSPAETVANPVRAALQSSPFWLLIFLAIAAVGGGAQFQTTRHWEAETFNRWVGESEFDTEDAAPVPSAAP
jgi:hypothetical protein